MRNGYSEVRTDDGRALEVLTGGDPDGFPLLFHGGSPSAAVGYPPFDRAAREAGLRLVTYSRPGPPARPPGHAPEPRMLDDIADSVVRPRHARSTSSSRGLVRRRTPGARLWPRCVGRCLAAAVDRRIGPHAAPGWT